ncbi:MAG: diphosphomevalonate decarboxylase [Candidatus Levyibacteriota bacterium]
MKATAIAPSNIAFIKYWGKKDEVLRLPANGSISMNLSNLLTTTTIEFSHDFKQDRIAYNGKDETNTASRVIKQLDRIRKLAKITSKAKVVTENNFPAGTGLSSSASGYAALIVAAVGATGLKLTEKELSMLARQGSGSACRSIPDGFVEWKDGDSSETSYAVSLHEPSYWDIVDVVGVVSTSPKDVSSSEGQKIAASSPFFAARLKNIDAKIKRMRIILKERDFQKFGELVEDEALELHAIYITSHPSLIYLLPGSLKVMHAVKRWRAEGIQVYFTVNTGQDIHLICQKKDAKKVAALAEEIPEVQKTIINEPAKGAHLIDKHLF